MHEITFRVERRISLQDIVIAWTVLLKDYIGSSNIGFFCTDATSSSNSPLKPKTVELYIQDDENLGQLSKKIKEQFLSSSRNSLHGEFDGLPSLPFLTHLYIAETESNCQMSSCRGKDFMKAPSNAGIDFTLECFMGQDRTINIIAMPCSSTATSTDSIQTLRILRQFEHVICQTHGLRHDALVSKISTASHSDIYDIWNWNSSTPPSPEKKDALSVFIDMVKIRSNYQAVNAWDGDLTYAELDQLSSAFAARLVQNASVGPGNIVPLCFEKSMWTPVAIWSVVKTGAAFVLLDENLPNERLQQIGHIIRRETRVVLSSASQNHRANLISSDVIIVDFRYLNMTDLSCLNEEEEEVTVTTKSSELIYIVFTSGSTGTPKAAMLSHTNVCTFSSLIGSLSDITHESRILALASYAYDVSLGNIFLAFLSGACLCIPSSWECKNDVGRVVQNYGITHAMITPSVSKMLKPSDCPTLQVLDLCGESCSEDALAKWRGTKTRVMNTYGPAECTVTTVANHNILLSSKPTIIGKGIGACWVMDPLDPSRFTPIGGIGELVVEGPLVGLGYLHDTKTTQEKFFDDPEWLQNGVSGLIRGRRGRLYRTGDLVRYTDDGLIDYIGRRDMQVKIRGQRIELGEVSSHLQKCIPARIEWCPEVVKLKNGAEILIVFFAIPVSNKTIKNLSQMFEFVFSELRKKLPPALVPGAFAQIDEIPLALTGKVDHRQLKHMGISYPMDKLIVPQTKPTELLLNTVSHSGNTDGSAYLSGNGGDSWDQTLPGKNDMNKFNILKTTWSDIFNIDTTAIGPSDNFFSQGGESLTAIRFVSAAARKGIQLDVITIFRYPRLSDLVKKARLLSLFIAEHPTRFSLLTGEYSLDSIALASSTTINNIEDAYPCTPLQEGLIIAEDSKSVRYVGRGVYKLPENINTQLFARSWDRVAEKHPILRTRIIDIDSCGLTQVILRDGNISLGVCKQTLDSYMRKDDERKMGLGTELCRWAIIHDRGSIYFVLTMHHSIYDGWTLPRIGVEVFRAYQGVRIEPTVGFNTFIKHTRSLPAEPAKKFWSRYLANSESTSLFPMLPHGIKQPRASSTVSKIFPVPSNETYGVSMPSLLRASWALLVSRLSGSDDVTFGATVSGRNVTINGIEELLSPTISTIPIRVKIGHHTTVESFVATVQNESLEAMPFENFGLQNIKNINADTRHGTNFQTLFIVHPPGAPSEEITPTESSSDQELKNMLEKLDISTALSDFNEYGVMILVRQEKYQLRVDASYDTRVLSADEMRQLLDQLAHVAGQIGQRKILRRSLQELSIASSTDIELIWNWNKTPFSGIEESIPSFIDKAISIDTQAHAIQAWDGSATFYEVKKLSSRLSQILQKNGVGRHSIVPICMEKTMWATIAMLSILKIGAAFVAMDAKHQPYQRLQAMMEQIGATCVVTAGPAQELARKLCDNVIICDNMMDNTSYSQAAPSQDVTSSPSDTAFLVFTSGSTGTPKGIRITHSNFCSTIEHHRRELKLSKQSRIYDYASYSFDIAVHNSLMALCMGACVCIPSEHDRENDIEGSFERLGANWTNITPSVARLIDPVEVPSLKTLVLSGEVVGKDLVECWAERVDLINAYGPAECQICTVQKNVKFSEFAADIGHAVGCTAWILDPEGENLLPIGAIGELVIEGPIVSPGYLNASSPRFIRDPSWLTTGSKKTPGRQGHIYRTGDLVRYRPDGTLVYMGRASAQAKINGQRVELGEVEFHIKKVVPELHELVVDLVSYNGTTLLTAFMVWSSKQQKETSRSLEKDATLEIESTSPPQGLQQQLKEMLPAHMVPNVYLKASHIPLTPTRKADRRQLKDYASSITKEELFLPVQGDRGEQRKTTPRERMLINIWSKVLKVAESNIHVESDFFQLGGDSISAMRLVKSCRQARLKLTVADVFHHSRLGQLSILAIEITDEKTSSEEPRDLIQPFSLVPVRSRDGILSQAASACHLSPGQIVDIYPCTPFQEAVFAMTAANSSSYVQHTKLKFSDKLSLERVLHAWDVVIAHNSILRTRLIQFNATVFQVVIRPEKPTWKWYDSSTDYVNEVEMVPMGLGRPLFKMGLIRNDSTTLIWTMHHAIYDAWSMDLILRQVSDIYSSQVLTWNGPNYNAFVNFIQCQSQESEKRWKSYLSGASNASIYPRSPQSIEQSSHNCLKRKRFAILEALPPGYSPAVILRAALAILISRYTSGEKVIFGETRLGRNVSINDIEKITGPTIASVPVLVHVRREQTIESFLRVIREEGIEMQGFEHLGLQNIARISEDARAACDFQTLLTFQETDYQAHGDCIFEIDDTIDDIRNFNNHNLFLYFSRTGKDIFAQAVFRRDVIPDGQVDLILDQIQTTFSKLCSLPATTPIQDLDLADAQDLAQIWKWNSNPAEAVDELINELISRNARKTPNKLAVAAHDGQMTYKELDKYSTNLAAKLTSRGIGLGCFVPLVFEKSAWVVAAMLAVIKTGAAFSLIDVSYPEKRLKMIIHVLQAQLVMASPSQSNLAKRLAEDVLIVNRSSCKHPGNLLRDNSILEPHSRDTNRLMYVCFTSGSTGLPKGVMVTHKNLASAIVPQILEAGFVPDDRVFDFTSHAFDVNIWHSYIALVAGACVCIPSQEDRVGDLAGSIASFQSTALFLTPSVARTIDPQKVPCVKRLYLGGEAVTPLDVSLWKDSVELWGAYGPTETTPITLLGRIFSPEEASKIGRGIGVRSWVCNPDNVDELVAIGAVGEMVNEGPLVSQGYLNQPEKTADVFIQDPSFLLKGLNGKQGRHGRLYRTGDLVRHCFDGTLQYVGRVDAQVKIRGQRVEFGEIEYHLKHALPNFPSVSEAIIHPSSGHSVLVAFCEISMPVNMINRVGVKAYLTKRLPPYMIPEFFLAISEIPKSLSGKTDRLKLREIGPGMLVSSTTCNSEIRAEYIHGPPTEIETLLVSLWSRAVGREIYPMSPGMDFVEMGGDSIAAMKLSNLARGHDLGLTVNNIVQNPKLWCMALTIRPIEFSSSCPRPFSLLEPLQVGQILARSALTCGVPVDFIADIYPCTPLQTELVALTMKQPQAYIKRSIFEVPSTVNLDKLIQSWDAVFSTNAILRTRFAEVPGQGLLQVVVKEHEWTEYDDLESYTKTCAEQNQDLGSPLAQIALVDRRNSPKIGWTVHHALYDEWSISIIEDQLSRAYRDLSIPRPPDFSAFVLHIISNDKRSASQFWQTRLAGCSSAMIYPALPSSHYQVRPSKTLECTIKPSIESNSGLQAQIHTAWGLLVAKLTGSSDVVFGATLAGRNAPFPGIEQVVGPTITPVPIRIRVDDRKQKVQDLLDFQETNYSRMAPYQHLGVKAIAKINEDTEAACKFQTLIVITPASERGTHIKTSTYDIYSKEREVFHTFALLLFLCPTSAGLDVQVIFDPDVLDEQEVQRLPGRLETIISSLTPNSTISDIEYLDKADRDDIQKWNMTVPLSNENLLHDIILASAKKFSDKTAIDAWDCSLSYLEINKLCNDLCIQLIGLGVRRGSIIPIISEKSGYVPIAALAVLKAGAAFFPLDYTQPLNRLQGLVDQVKPPVILTGQSSMDTALKLVPNALLIRDCRSIQATDGMPLKSRSSVQVEDVACILFTSGSTGTPKGVMQTHRALSSAVKYQASQSGFSENTRSFEFASYSFDVSWNMIFKTLAVGGTLCVPSEEQRQNDLAGALYQSAATLTELTASVARLINPRQIPHLETLILSGEPVDVREFENWLPRVRLVVCYGPSECTSVSIMNPGLGPCFRQGGIGRGSGCLIWIVDPENFRKLMPVGAVGEVLIQGPIVGKGYYNNDKSTRAAYVSDLPWLQTTKEDKSIEGNGAFLSGDLAKYDKNGNIHFVSRKDLQVKLRGQRIELEEVQYHVREAMGDLVGPVVSCVLGDSKTNSEQRLATFLSGKKAAACLRCELAAPDEAAAMALETMDEKLGNILPKYMVPSVYYFITTIPHTNNGKIDRRKLADLAASASLKDIHRGRPDTQQVRRKPCTKKEAKMQELWAVALGLPADEIGAEDNFFNLNGDSISAMKLVSAARSEGFDIRVSDVFSNPKLSDLAKMKVMPEAAQTSPKSSEIGPFHLLGSLANTSEIRSEVSAKCDIQNPDTIEDVYPCTPLQESMLAATIKDQRAFTSMRVFQLPKDINIDRLRDAWAAVVTRHRILRTRLVDLKSHGLSQAVIKEENIKWETYDSINAFIKQSKNAHMGLATPLTRWAVIDGQGDASLIWTIHHATYDGWTLPIIENELRKSYFGQKLDESYLDMRPLVDYVVNMKKEDSVSFWSTELADAGESTFFPSLPHQKFEPEPETYLEKTISAELTSANGIGLSALLYGSWSVLVSHVTASNKASFGAILTGRNAPIDGIDRVIGPAVTTVPIMVNITPQLTVQAFLAQIHDMTIRRIPHEHLGVHAISRINASCAIGCNFQTVLVIQPHRSEPYSQSEHTFMRELDETQIEGFPDQHSVLNQYGLMMEILPIKNKMTIRASFDSRLVSGAEIERLVNRWEYVIGQMSRILNQGLTVPISSIDLLCKQDLDDIWTWNAVVPEAVTDLLVHEKISKIACRQPDAVAIDAWDGQLTYYELDALSSRLAHVLTASGVGPGCFVPLIFPKSRWANVSMLAVLKAAGSFVPLDADHPEGHLRAIMQPLNAEIILCSVQTRDRAARLARNAILVDAESLSARNFGNGNDSTSNIPRPMPDDIAYAVFTSGSTGAAKGVRISHKNLATAIEYQAGPNGYRIDSSTRSLDSSSYSFDACVCNFFYTVTQGGCLCVPSNENLKGDIGVFIRDYRINWAQLVPSVARTIEPHLCYDLKSLILTGEPLTKSDIETWCRQVRLVNAYGPTECTILCAISPQILGPRQLGCIGSGRGANLWLTEIGNPNKLAPIGVPGEILIEGPIIGAGYLKPYEYPVVESPQWLLAGTHTTPGRRGTLFRTGDQARYTEDGGLVFIGRIGSQIKLRGQRVDLAAVEDAVRHHMTPGLEIAVEIIHMNLGGEGHDRQILLAFASFHATDERDIPSVQEKLQLQIPILKEGLDASLPAYLQPEAFVMLAEIPKTSSGKTDRRRLSEKGKKIRFQELLWIRGDNAKTSSTPPSSKEEWALATLWAEILKIDCRSIAREDDFFKLGGDSLGVMRLTSKAHERGVRLKTSDVFKTSTLSSLAVKMKDLKLNIAEDIPYRPYSLVKEISNVDEFARQHIVPTLRIDLNQIEDILPANGFQIDYMHNEEEPLGLQYAYLDISPKVSWDRLVKSCQTVIETFQCLRARFLYHEGRYYQVILKDAPLVTEKIVSKEQITTFSNKFCPEDGREAGISDIFTKMTLVDTGHSRRRVILRMSHMQNDGWCTPWILQNIANVFNGNVIEKTPDWTSLLHYRRLTANDSHQYWRKILQDTSCMTPPLIHQPSGTKVRTLRSYALPYFHTSEDNRRTRPTVVVNVAWALVLQQLAGHNDVVFGNVTTGRNGDLAGLDKIIGPCVNMLPFRLQLFPVEESTGNRRQYIRNLVEMSAQQVDERTSHEGLDWEEMVQRATAWPSGTRYSSAVHFRNMAFEPELRFGDDLLTVVWYELVAEPHWTTVLVYPEGDVLRLWLLSNPAEIGDEGADQILETLAGYCDEIINCLRD